MWLKAFSVAVLALCAGAAASNLDRYEGYNKYTVFHNGEDAFNYLVDLQTESTELDFWLLTRNMSVVTVSPTEQSTFEARLNELNAQFVAKPLMEEMAAFNETLGACEGSECELNRPRRQARGFFSHFPRYSEVLNYMSALAARHPHNCRYESLGRSSEGRHIAALSISLNSRVRDRRVAYIQSATHGREWITPLTVLYLANELLNNLRAFQRVLQDVEIYLVPLVNPDGYEYSFTNDRFWRKNRHRYGGRSCAGVDINRNFPNNWNYNGASQNLCSEVYSGTGPTSEPETAAVARYLEYNRHRVKLSLDVHSFGKFLFYPYGYSRNAVAPTRNLLHSVAQRAANQIAKYRGTHYTVGTSASILYEASGGLDDYAYGNLGIPMSFTVELPGENFQVAPSDIIHICKETFAGFIEFIRHVSLY
ncbi:carboxypeptidase B [Bactrocera dorsalis]|uniref:Carboxypeptidase B n=1 Tax=Bactrocera dorsalis TaxID=27457 RepID=A0ABM3JX88_BACDO|nr:carboxypeptidase B [Bactrocera dorsalis]XP_049313847.1 carboxypeptidase B [Bactrocera dorsalis]